MGNEIDEVPLDDVVRRNFMFDENHVIDQEHRLMKDVVKYRDMLCSELDYVVEHWNDTNIDEDMYNFRLNSAYENMRRIVRVLEHFWYR